MYMCVIKTCMNAVRYIYFYYIHTSVLLENIPLVKFIKTTSGTRVVYYWAACAPSHKMGFRSSAAKNGLPGEGRHEGLVRRDDVVTDGFI